MFYGAKVNGHYEADTLDELCRAIAENEAERNDGDARNIPQATRLFTVDDDGEQHDLPAAELKAFNDKLESAYEAQCDGLAFCPHKEWGTCHA